MTNPIHSSDANFITHLMEQSSDAFFYTNIDNTIQSWNKGAEKLLGFMHQEVIGKDLLNLGIFKLSGTEIINMLHCVTKEGVWQSAISLFSKERTQFTKEIIISDIQDEKGNVIAFCFKIKKESITDSNQNNDELIIPKDNYKIALENSKNFNQNLFENSPVPMWITDAKILKFLAVNDLAVKEYGYSKEEFLSMSLLDIRPVSEKDTFLNLDRSKLTMYDDLRIGTWKHKIKDGSIIEVEIINHPIIFKGEEARIAIINNITQRLVVEKALEKSERKFRTIIEKGNDIVTLFDKDFNVIYRSPSSYRLTGWNDDEVIGLSGMEHVHPEDIEIVKKCISSGMQNPGEYINASVRLLYKNGEYRWIEGMAANLLNDDSINAILFNYRDVTDKKLQEEKLAVSERRFKALIENSNDIVSLFDKNMNVIYRSPSAEKLLGWADEEVMNKRATINVYPDDYEYVAEKIRVIVHHPGTPYPVTFRLMHKNGKVLWVEGTVINLLEDKNVHAIVFNYRDITEKKAVEQELSASESQFQNLIDRISDAFLSLDNEFRVTYANAVVEKLLHNRPGTLIGANFIDKFNRHSDDYLYKLVTEVNSTNKSKRFDCFSNILQKWISGTIYPSSSGLTLFFRDNSDRKKLEIELQQQQHKEQIKLISATLEAQEKERNAIGIELHDNVNQILVGTIMILSLLKKHPEKTDLIEESINNMKRAINENRNIAHILVSPDLESKSFHEQIQYLGNEMLYNSGIQFIIKLDEDANVLLQKDQQVALYRIVQEQFTNIVKYAKATVVSILLEAIDGKVLKMKITDNGKGMDENTVSKGIGLRNIGSRLSIFNGVMRIETKPGEGFALEVEMPVS